eukprot:CAMPEP_0174239918 /NCGR_PEP_ID=MMETSP0417-20130205/16677_1 /TAXON_ID=242541 /ORGANISM="Mayorella sp, Strain BSH-02190019" /LENGTH=405 /DNA_ID=CAMNT_0015318915 /DNA_START=282 /DNA_END=1496 /DNA_ORIENTATION=+
MAATSSLSSSSPAVSPESTSTPSTSPSAFHSTAASGTASASDSSSASPASSSSSQTTSIPAATPTPTPTPTKPPAFTRQERIMNSPFAYFITHPKASTLRKTFFGWTYPPSNESADDCDLRLHRINALSQSLGGAGAGAAASLVTCPLDVAKVRLQVQRTHHSVSQYVGTAGTLKRILADEGIRGLYRGLGVTLIALVPNWTIYFTAYNEAKRTLHRAGHMEEGPLLHMGAAAMAGVFTNVCTNPFWVVKTRLQSQHFTSLTTGHSLYKGTFHAFRTIRKQEGIRTFWNGLSPQLLGITHVMVQFPFYEFLKKEICIYGKKESPDHLNPAELILASATSKVVASSAAYPHEVIRARFQSQRVEDPHRYHGIRDAIRRILAEEGIAAFYRGLPTNLMRVVPSCAIT